MKRILVIAVAVILGITAVYFLVSGKGIVTAGEQEQFGGVVVGVASGGATVQDIDYESRLATLKYDNGNIETIKAGPEVKNFTQVNKGDRVNINYAAVVTLLVGGPAQPLSRSEAVEVERAPLGEKPAETVKAVTDISAVIEDVDYVNRLVTIKGPQRTLKIKIDPQEENLEKIKKAKEYC